MSLEARFKCDSVEHTSEAQIIKLSAITGPGSESWAKYTPSGGLNMYITNPDAFGQVVPGKHYRILIEEVTE